MTTPKNVTPEELVTEVLSSFLGGFGTKPKADAPVVDNVAEVNRLLAKAETVATENSDEAAILLQIADRHLRLIDTALAYQK